MQKRLVIIYLVLVVFVYFIMVGCAAPRSNSIFPLQFSDQASRALMRIERNGVTSVVQGVFACEEKQPREAKVAVKIMPVPGRVIYSNGIDKKVEDFNWRETGFLIWKRKQIKDTWIDIDLGELNTIFGDVPVAFDVSGLSKSGVIVSRGIIFHRVCNDRDVPCSKLIVKYACGGKVLNTWAGQLGSCNRMAGAAQDFELPLRTPDYNIPVGSRVIFTSGRSNWSVVKHISDDDIHNGSLKITYDYNHTGPDLIGVRVLYSNQGVIETLQTYILLVNYAQEWTGIDNPHFLVTENFNGRKHYQALEFSKPVLSDLMEVVEGDKRAITTDGRIEWDAPKNFLCAYAWHRASGDITTTCVDKNLKETRIQ